jgi:hypothetical protein
VDHRTKRYPLVLMRANQVLGVLTFETEAVKTTTS